MTRILAGLLLVLLWVLPARAQDPVAVPLTVDDAVARAFAESQRIAEAEARHAGAEAVIGQRRAAERPTVAVSAGYTRTNHVEEFGIPQPDGTLRVIYPDIPDNSFTRLSLQWPIYTAGRNDALIRAAQAEAAAADADVRTARADLRLEVVRAYWALATATDSVRVVEEALARADAHLHDVRSQFETGLIPPNEVTAVEAQRARQEMQLIEAQNLRRSTLEDLRRLTGLSGDIITVTALEERGSRVHGSTVQGSARPEQEALRARVTAAEQRLQAVQAGRRPTIAFNASADYANPNPRIFPRADVWRSAWEVGVVATWTLWDGGRIAAESAEAAATVRAWRARQSDLDSMIATDVRQRELDLDSSRAALVAAESGVRAAAETRRVVAERFNVGVATSTDVLDAQVALLQAELDRTRAMATIRLAEARLERARGQ